MSSWSFLGALGALGLQVGLVLASLVLLGRLQRWFGVRGFGWFSVQPAEGARIARLLARVLSGSLPLLVGYALLAASLTVTGKPEFTTEVKVLPGPARDAGMRDGDRVLAVGGESVQDWNQLRARIGAQTGPVRVDVDRAGARLELSVTPVDRKIGVTAGHSKRPIGFGAALIEVLPFPIELFEGYVRLLFVAEQSELRGPVGIVREASTFTDWGFLLWRLGFEALELWPYLLGMHAFDVATRWLFKQSHPGATSSQGYQQARLYQAHLLALLGFAATILFALVAAFSGAVAVASGLLPLALPATYASYPLIWVTGLHFWSRSRTTWMLVVSTCAAPFISIHLRGRLAESLRRQGFKVSFGRAVPA